MAELVTIRKGQTLLSLTMRFPAGTLDGFVEANVDIKKPDGSVVTRPAAIDFDSAIVSYALAGADLPLAEGIYSYVTRLTDAQGRFAYSRDVGRFRAVAEFAT